MKKVIILFICAVFLTSFVFVPSATASKKKHADNQIIVKFKPDVAQVAYEAMGKGGLKKYLKKAGTLDVLNTKYKVKKIERVFKSLEKRDKKGKLVSVKSAKSVAERNFKKKEFKQETIEKSIKHVPAFENVFVLEVPKGINIDEAVQAFNADINVEYAEPAYLFELSKVFRSSVPSGDGGGRGGNNSVSITPNDSDYSDQWSLPKVQADYAWGLFSSQENIGKNSIAAVLDDGLFYLDQDIADNVWINPGEFPGVDTDGDGAVSLDELVQAGLSDNNANGFMDPGDIFGSVFADLQDNDNNGYADDFFGWDFEQHDNDPIPSGIHGSHIAGTIAAVTNNNWGIAGLSWNTKVMPVTIGYGSSGDIGIFSTNIANGIFYAVNNGADTINMSFGFQWREPCHLVEDAISYATNLGVILIAAAGNTSMEGVDVPAAYPDVIAVAATDQNDQPADFTSYGELIDVSAPGVDILSLPGYMSGTSMASPHVVGLANLILSHHDFGEGVMRAERVKRVIMESADSLNLSSQYLAKMGAGRINAKNAILKDPNETLLARITYPNTSYYPHGGLIDIEGIAMGAGFQSYDIGRIIYGSPDMYEPIVTNITTPQGQGTLLGGYSTEDFADGYVHLEIHVHGENGRIAKHYAFFRVDNYTSNIFRGVVSSQKSGLPLTDIDIQVYQDGDLLETVQTDKYGQYQSSILPDGEYTLVPISDKYNFTPQRYENAAVFPGVRLHFSASKIIGSEEDDVQIAISE